jgi:hypothetical protein
MFTLPDVVHLFANELARLRRGRFALAFVTARSLDSLFLGHKSLKFGVGQLPGWQGATGIWPIALLQWSRSCESRLAALQRPASYRDPVRVYIHFVQIIDRHAGRFARAWVCFRFCLFLPYDSLVYGPLLLV